MPDSNAKTLILVRHGKSSWTDSAMQDFDRPLNGRGLRDAPLMARAIANQLPNPELILCSTAQRTRETVQFVADALISATTPGLEFMDDLYLAPPILLETKIAAIDDGVSTLLVIAHNPGLTEFHNHLVPSQPLDNLPTFGVAEIELRIDSWSEVLHRPKANRIRFLSPKTLDATS
jgi:phosphohistidine phosphatase